eukprot:TRINITY_DN17756_c0_g2_i1.p1 TRINITY_DN17756_c0_g2~~TRINITY_DN17756_c0_g2_i1.p1  ORF type:complete len:865 (-),score=178.73 TRINITY_DN17756_c0_g2_i1:70-2637(-)
MVAAPAVAASSPADAEQLSADGVAKQSPAETLAQPAHKCGHCGVAFASRNALFRHLGDKCDPLAAKVREEKERLVFVLSYLGSRFRCVAIQNEREEAALPSVEGALVAAVRRAWGDVFQGVVRCTRTDRGFHAAENVVILSLRPSLRDDAALLRELDGSGIRLLAPPRPVAAQHRDIFDRVYAAKKRTYHYYIPYFALLDESERARWCCFDTCNGSDGLERSVGGGEKLECRAQEEKEGLWIGPVSYGCTPRDIKELLLEQGISIAAEDVFVTPGQGHAQVGMSEATAIRGKALLHGFTWHGEVLTALLLSEANAKFQLQRRVRAVIKAFKDGGVGKKATRSYHNFISPQVPPNDPTAMRSLLHCNACGINETDKLRSSDAAGSWAQDQWTKVSFSAVDFGPQQLRRMAGALVAIVRGSEPLSYLERCFDTVQSLAPAAPAESVCLSAIEFGPAGSDWRTAASVDIDKAKDAREEIERRVVVDATDAWKEFLVGLDGGSTRAELRTELAEAADRGNLTRLLTALNAGAPVNAANEYGQTAAFLAAQAGQAEVLRALVNHRADLCRSANGGITPCKAAAARRDKSVVELIAEVGADTAAGEEASTFLRNWTALAPVKPSVPREETRVVTVIPRDANHAGAGTVVIDGAFGDEFLQRLERLWRCLPLAPKEKASPTDRAYFADAEGWVTREMLAAVASAGLPDAAEALPLMRFLIYPEPGGFLPAHVDLPRTEACGRRSTYTFLLYLSDCDTGGETAMLECLPGDAALASSGGVSPGPRAEVAAVKPRRGRLLLMPHACPHLAAPIQAAPKVLVRGEVSPPHCWSAPPPQKRSADAEDPLFKGSMKEVCFGVQTCFW